MLTHIYWAYETLFFKTKPRLQVTFINKLVKFIPDTINYFKIFLGLKNKKNGSIYFIAIWRTLKIRKFPLIIIKKLKHF